MTQQQALALQAEDWFKIEPNDRYNFVGDTQKNPKGYTHAAIWVNTGGDICLRSSCGSEEVFKNVPSGSFLAVSCVGVKAAGTTPTVDLIGVIQKSELAVK
jgi:hypothetical protein